MRGNEICIISIKLLLSMLFPIPMRGNEEPISNPKPSATPAFPIPMRGNESLRRRMPRLIGPRFRSP